MPLSMSSSRSSPLVAFTRLLGLPTGFRPSPWSSNARCFFPCFEDPPTPFVFPIRFSNPFPASRNGRRSALSASSAAASSHASSSSAPHARRFEPSGTFWSLPAGDDGALLLPPIGPPIGPTPPPAVPTPRPLSSVFTRRTSLPYSSICLASCRFFPASDRHSVSTACLGSSRRNLCTQHDVSPNLEL